MAEGARLESVYRVKPIGGSNPPLSVDGIFANAKIAREGDSSPVRSQTEPDNTANPSPP